MTRNDEILFGAQAYSLAYNNKVMTARAVYNWMIRQRLMAEERGRQRALEHGVKT